MILFWGWACIPLVKTRRYKISNIKRQCYLSGNRLVDSGLVEDYLLRVVPLVTLAVVRNTFVSFDVNYDNGSKMF